MVSLKLGVLEVAIAFVLWQYSVRLKYIFLIGNIVVALFMALTIMVIGFAARYMLVVWLGFYTFFAFLMGLIREIVKDVEDMEGDARYDAKTLPNVLGFFKTKVVLYYLTLFAISLLIFSCVYMFYQHYYILGLYLIIFALVPLGYFLKLLIDADSKKDFSTLSALNKLIMLAGVISMAFRCAA
jgi:4-hydroxybenzoate polyprenyltransferase